MSRLSDAVVDGHDRLLSVNQVGELLGTGSRFPRRLVAERRIVFVKAGRHVRIPESAVRAFLEAGTVNPVTLGGAV